jgi:hypothetical protein
MKPLMRFSHMRASFALLQMFLITACSAATDEPANFDQLTSIPLDDRRLVKDSWILYPAGNCAQVVESEW